MRSSYIIVHDAFFHNLREAFLVEDEYVVGVSNCSDPALGVSMLVWNLERGSDNVDSD